MCFCLFIALSNNKGLSILYVDWPQLETISLYQLSWFEINICMCNKDFNLESLYWSRDASILLKKKLHPNIIDYIFDLSQALHLYQNIYRWTVIQWQRTIQIQLINWKIHK